MNNTIKKMRLFLILSVFVTVIASPKVYATNKDTPTIRVFKNDEYEVVYSDYCNSETLKDMGKINKKNAIEVNGEINPLACTFENGGEALSNLKKKIPEYLAIISKTNSLVEINSKNWRQYWDGMFNVGEKYENIYTDGHPDYMLLFAFLDMYAGYERNEKIINYVSNKSNAQLKKEDVFLELSILFPYYAPISVEAQEIRKANAAKIPPHTFNLTAANAYAIKWSPKGKYNYPTYLTQSSDCVNFASQIAYAGGVPMTSTWKHKAIIPGTLYEVTSAWIWAQDFMAYMTVDSATNIFLSFTKNIRAGDFIAYDSNRNGYWDHVGYVTQRDSTSATYYGKTYYDFKVAQHDGNYHLWASSKDNKWDDQPSGTIYAYARITSN